MKISLRWAWWPLAYPDPGYRERVLRSWNDSVTRTIEKSTPFSSTGSSSDMQGMALFAMLWAYFLQLANRASLCSNDITQERGDRMKSDFIATAAHELRTPLTSVKGFTELLLSDNSFNEAEQREYLSIVYDKAEVLESIIDDLLDLGRVESGQLIVLDKQVCNIGALVFSSVDSCRKEFQGHCFKLVWPELEPGEVVADPGKIAQVLDNLLSNAVKFSPPGSSICVRGSVADGEVRISVQDEGVGMDPEQISKVFDKFYRINSSDTAPAGLGLGLAIAKGIIEAHGSSIWVESEPGKGTKVSFSLPLEKTDVIF
ncbi:MAG: HAMP domain-containing sensor histidine kinase [Syntrophotaleaceae bacterium]